MDTQAKINTLQNIANALGQDSQIEGVYLEYPAYLSVVINESTETGVSFGFNPDDEDDETQLYWNDFGAFSGNWHNGIRVNGNFPIQPTAQETAQMLINDLKKAGYLK